MAVPLSKGKNSGRLAVSLYESKGHPNYPNLRWLNLYGSLRGGSLERTRRFMPEVEVVSEQCCVFETESKQNIFIIFLVQNLSSFLIINMAILSQRGASQDWVDNNQLLRRGAPEVDDESSQFWRTMSEWAPNTQFLHWHQEDRIFHFRDEFPALTHLCWADFPLHKCHDGKLLGCNSIEIFPSHNLTQNLSLVIFSVVRRVQNLRCSTLKLS